MGTLGAVRFLRGQEIAFGGGDLAGKRQGVRRAIFQIVSSLVFVANTTVEQVLGCSTACEAASSDTRALLGDRLKGRTLGEAERERRGSSCGPARRPGAGGGSVCCPGNGLSEATRGRQAGRPERGGGPKNGFLARFLSWALWPGAPNRSRQTLHRLFSGPVAGTTSHQPPPATPAVRHFWSPALPR